MLSLLERCGDHRRAVHGHVQLDAGGHQRLQGRQLLLDLAYGLDDVGAGLAIDHQQHRVLIVEEPAVVAVLHRVAELGHVAQAQHRAVLVANHQGLVVLGFLQLVVGLHLPVALAIFDKALGPALVGIGDGLAHVIEGHAILVEQLRLEFDAHRRQRTAADLHLAYPRHLGQALGQDGRGQVVQLALLQHAGGQCQDHDRRLGRIVFLVGGHAAHAAGQQVARGVDGSLHLARRRVDVTALVEAEDYPGRALAGTAGQGVDPGDRAHGALQRRGHGRGHDLGAGARQAGLDHDHRELDLRQRRHRQQAEADATQQHDRQAQEHGRYRAADKGRGEVHGRSCTAASGCGRMRRASRSKYR
ncbi:hypothetical protein D3C80_440540 [compost metagenome]